jgi:hypothetical protein
MEYKNAQRVPLQFNARQPSPVEAVAGRRSGFPEALKSIRELKGDTPDARHANMTAKCVRVVDFETTGLDPASSDVIEVGWCDVYEDCRIQGPYSLLVKTDRPIEIEARAAHHIGPEDLTKGVSGSLWKPYLCYNEPIAFIAHNSKFEASFWPEAPAPWICTCKSAMRLFPEAPRFTNSVLRYYLDLGPHVPAGRKSSADVPMDRGARNAAAHHVRHALRQTLVGGSAGLFGLDAERAL